MSTTPSPAPERLRVVAFQLDAQHHALPLASVERVVHAVAVTPLPGAPPAVLGAIDVAGNVVPVYSLRRRLQLPERPLQPSDQFLLVQTGRRPLALVVDQVQGVIECEEPVVPADRLAPGLQPLGGVVSLADGLLLIQDIERFLSPAEESALAAALDRLG